MANGKQQRGVFTQTAITPLQFTTHHMSKLWHKLYHFMWHNHNSMSIRQFNFNVTSSMMSLAKCHPIVTATSTFLHQCHVIILSPITFVVFLTQTILYLQELYSKPKVLLNFYLSGCYIWVYIILCFGSSGPIQDKIHYLILVMLVSIPYQVFYLFIYFFLFFRQNYNSSP